MPNVRASSGTIGTMSSPISLSRRSFDKIRTNTIVVEALRPSVPAANSSKSGSSGAFERFGPDGARRHEAAEGLAALAQVLELEAVVRRTIERRVGDGLVRDRNAEARPERAQVGFVQLLLLVRDVLAFAGLAEAVALDRPHEHDRRLPLGLDRDLVGVVDLDGIVAAEPQLLELIVGQVLDHLEQARVGAEEVLAEVGAGLDGVLLILAVDDLAHPLGEQAVVVGREQRIPVAAPQHLDDVPAGAAEDRFELLDDLAVAADRTVEALQVAVDDEDQVVELLARREADRAERFGLVGLAVAEERPDLGVRRLAQPAILEVAVEARLVDRHDRAEAHRHRRELPEVRHQPRVRIGRKSAALGELLAEVVQLLDRQPAFEERARVDAGRGVPLEVDQVAVAVLAPGRGRSG